MNHLHSSESIKLLKVLVSPYVMIFDISIWSKHRLLMFICSIANIHLKYTEKLTEYWSSLVSFRRLWTWMQWFCKNKAIDGSVDTLNISFYQEPVSTIYFSCSVSQSSKMSTQLWRLWVFYFSFIIIYRAYKCYSSLFSDHFFFIFLGIFFLQN